MIIAKKKQIILPLIITVLALFFSVTLFIFNQHQADAVVSNWKAGNIMSDAVMTDKTTMSVSKIQNFLNSKVPSCDTNGTKTSEFSGGKDYNKDGRITRAEWGRYKYGQTTFVCLKNYAQGGKTAAQIIYNAAQKYSINPQVLLVLLQKEQGLVKDTWPLNIQYRSATGYGCPDTAPCDSDYYGLTNQLDWAAKMFRAILNNSPSWYTPYELGTNYIRYSPDSSCGGSNVYIENRATQALYNYTPYQPNKGALNAGWGTASCGAYGNRNFYLYFSEWFGNPRAGYKYSGLQSARWMQTKTDTYKKDPVTGQNTGGIIATGTQIYFPDKITLNGTMYLRTQHDSDLGYNKGIPYTQLEEVSVSYDPLLQPRWLETVDRATYKKDPVTGKSVGPAIPPHTKIYFPTKTELGGNALLRTQHDSDRDNGFVFRIEDLNETSFAFTDFKTPRWMEVRSDTYVKNIKTMANSGSILSKGTHIFLDHKVSVNGETYMRSGAPASGAYFGIPLSNLKNLNLAFEALKQPRELRIKASTYKQDPVTGQNVDASLATGQVISFSTKTYVNGIIYLRTTHDTTRGYKKAIPFSQLEEIN